MHAPLVIAGIPEATTAVPAGMALGDMVIIGTILLSIVGVIAVIIIANRMYARRGDEGE
ncbi:MAG: hypothetical protein P8I91_08610 [Phycisphaerales bacterium]|jgi:hypothetical protein|nr:hypothetical protein [Phycisphaerales bacterium]